MDIQTAIALNDINTRFYQEQAESFSSTRHGSWAGWEKALEVADIQEMPELVTDVACGNQRFEEFLLGKFPRQLLQALCIDNCVALNQLSQAPEGSNICFEETDIVSELLEGRAPHFKPNDLTVCFGFMHHIPTVAARKLLLDAMYQALMPGGALIVSFWQFMSVESIARQALELTKDCSLELEENDYLLGWQNSPTARRYCHNFDMEQVQQLTPVPSASLFEADGRNGRLNIYLVAAK